MEQLEKNQGESSRKQTCTEFIRALTMLVHLPILSTYDDSAGINFVDWSLFPPQGVLT